MGLSGPQSPGAPSLQEHVWNQAQGLGTVCSLSGVKGVLYVGSFPVAFQVYCALLQLRDSDKALMPYSMYTGTTAWYSGLIMFSGLLFHSFPSFLKYYFGFGDFCEAQSCCFHRALL